MEEEKNFLALVDEGFELNDEVTAYFNSKDVVVVKHLPNLNVLQLRSRKDLTSEDLKYINHIEKEQTMRSGSSEDEDTSL